MKNNKGLTLIELLIGVTISMIVLAATYAIFISQHKSYTKISNIKEIQETARAALLIIKRDVIMGGYGLEDKRLAFYIEDGGSNGPDKLYISDWEFLNETEVIMDKYGDTKFLGSGTTSITVENLDLDGCVSCVLNNGCPSTTCCPDDNWYGTSCYEFQGGISQYVISNDDSLPLHKVAKINNVTASSKKLDLDQVLEGNLVSPAIFYCVDTGDSICHPSNANETFVLRRSNRSSGGRAPLASDIVDLQIAYWDKDAGTGGTWYCDGSGPCPMSPFDPRKIDLLRISIVARTNKRDFGWKATNRPALENRSAGEEDGYFYRVYTVYVRPRNTNL